MSKSLEHYTTSDRSDHEIAKRAIARQLYNADYESRLSGRELAEGVPVSESTVRDLIREIRRDYGMPVYSFGSGYFRIQSVEQFERAISKIDDEIATREKTKQQLAKGFNAGRL